MHDDAAQERRLLNSGGIAHLPGGTLSERAVQLLRGGPRDSRTIAREIMGLSNAPDSVADRLATLLLEPDPRIRRGLDGRWVLAQGEPASRKLTDCTFAVVDVETTGTRHGAGGSGRDRIIEIAIVILARGEIKVALDELVNPERAIPRRIMSLTRIEPAELAHKPVFEAVADRVMTALAGRVFVAHNVQFDWGFVRSELRRARQTELSGPRLCTARLARKLIPGLRSRGLDSVASFLGVEISRRHRAGGDALATAQVLEKLVGIAIDNGAETLDDLLALDRRRKARRTALPYPMDEA